jgi:hypothetical protein
MIARPNAAFMDNHKRVIEQPCRPTNGLAYTLHATGMGAWIGNQTHPSMVLLDCHMGFMDHSLDQKYLAATTLLHHKELDLAGFSNLLFWLGWLRSSKSFGLAWLDMRLIEPRDSATVDLPAGCGLISCRLGPETKSAWTHQLDVPLAYKTLSGLHIGKWFHRARQTAGLGPHWYESDHPIFLHHNGTK